MIFIWKCYTKRILALLKKSKAKKLLITHKLELVMRGCCLKLPLWQHDRDHHGHDRGRHHHLYKMRKQQVKRRIVIRYIFSF